MYYISDLNDHPIKVTDLTEAIKQAREFSRYRSADKAFAPLDQHRAKYWTDMYNKLVQLQEQLKNDEKTQS